jgi:dCMP deaminase
MKYDSLYMAMAEAASRESKCPRTQVGCAVVLESGIIAPGFNGHASGGPNEWAYSDTGNPEVVHAELNALGKCLEQGLSAKGASVYVTLSPCLPCAMLLVRAKVKRVVYRDDYRLTEGLDYLRKYKIPTIKYTGE